jgi:hypothetical protein
LITKLYLQGICSSCLALALYFLTANKKVFDFLLPKTYYKGRNQTMRKKVYLSTQRCISVLLFFVILLSSVVFGNATVATDFFAQELMEDIGIHLEMDNSNADDAEHNTLEDYPEDDLILMDNISYHNPSNEVLQAGGVTILSWSWEHSGSNVLVRAIVQNNTGGHSRVGFAAIGYNVSGEAVQVGYSGSLSMSNGWTGSHSVTLSAGSQITRVEVIPVGDMNTGSAEMIASGFRYEGGNVIVTGVVQNATGDNSRYGFAAIGYNANGEAIQVGYNGSISASNGSTSSYSVTLSAGSQITRVEVIPVRDMNTGSVEMIVSGFRRDGGNVVVTGVVQNATGGNSYAGFAAIGYNANGEAIQVGYNGFSSFPNGWTGSYSVTLSAGSQITRVEVIPVGDMNTGSAEMIASGFRYEGGNVIVTGVVQNATGDNSRYGFAAIGYNANGEAIQVGYNGSISASNGSTSSHSVTLSAGSQITCVEVIPVGNMNTGSVELIAGGYRRDNGNVIVTGVTQNATGGTSRTGFAAIGYNASGEAIQVGYSGSGIGYSGSGSMPNGWTDSHSVTLSAGSQIESIEIVSPFSHLTGELKLIEKGYFINNGNINASAVVHNDSASSERVTMILNGYDASGRLVRTSSLVANVTSKNVSTITRSMSAANVHRVEIAFDVDFGWSQNIPPPSAPSNLRVGSRTQNSITLEWGASTNATRYRIYQLEGINNTPVQVGSVNGINSTSFTVPNLSPNTQHVFRVRAENSAGVLSNDSNTLTAWTTLAVPTNLNATVTHNSANITWGQVSGASSYTVVLISSSDDEPRESPAISNSTTIAGLSPGTRYSYHVRANFESDTGRSSAFSSASQLTTDDNRVIIEYQNTLSGTTGNVPLRTTLFTGQPGRLAENSRYLEDSDNGNILVGWNRSPVQINETPDYLLGQEVTFDEPGNLVLYTHWVHRGWVSEVNVNMQLYSDTYYDRGHYGGDGYESFVGDIRLTANRASRSFSETLGINFIINNNIRPSRTIKNDCDHTNVMTARNNHICNVENHYTVSDGLPIFCGHHSYRTTLLDRVPFNEPGLHALFFAGNACRNGLTNGADGHTNGILGVAYTPGRRSIQGYSINNAWRSVRVTQHEWSHNYGANHNGGEWDSLFATQCIGTCIMNADDDFFDWDWHVPDVWCSRCKAAININRNLH